MKLTVPSQHSHPDPSVENHPRALRQWVESLPYLNPVDTAGQAREFLQRLNRQPLPAQRRLEALDILAIPYWRLLDALLSTPLPQIRDQGQQRDNLQALQRYCQDLAFGYKITVHDSLGPTGLFRRNRPRQSAVLQAIQYLGQQLNHRYAEYQRIPGGLWLEIDQLYRYARKQGFHQEEVPGARGVTDSIERAYLEIALLRAGDPFRLPGGSLWETRALLRRQIDQARILPWEDDMEGDGLYYLPAANPEADGYRQGLCLDIRRLADTLETLLENAPGAGIPGFSDRLEKGQDHLILRCLLQGWRQKVSRKAERTPLQVDAELAIGLESAFYFLNRGRAFNRHAYLSGGADEPQEIGVDAVRDRGTGQGASFPSLPCRTLNRSAGGIALHCNRPLDDAPRVGQLIAVRSRSKGSEHPGVWFIASTRWLRVESQAFFEVGAQYLGRDAVPTAVRVLHGERGTHEFHAALSIELQQSDRLWHILIGPQGLYSEGRLLELVRDGHRSRARCTRLLETGSGFERFRYEPVAT